MPLLVHVTDLHLDHWPQNLDKLVALLRDIPADIFLVGGDNGGEEGIKRTVVALTGLRKRAKIAWIVGNHDLWRRPYTDLWHANTDLPATYLEMANLETPYCTIVGTYGHYDYSGGDPTIPISHYETYTNGGHIWNDRFIDRLGKSNPEIAGEIVQRFQQRYKRAIDRGLPVVVLTHTWPFAPTLPAYRTFLSAYCCNQQVGDVIAAFEPLPTVLFCGHTHQPSRWDEFGFPMINTGSDYDTVRITEWELRTPRKLWWRLIGK